MSWTLYSVRDFPRFRDAWDVLNGRTANSVLLDGRFIEPLINHFGTGKELLAVHSGEAGIDCAAILCKIGGGRWTTFQPSQAPLGCWLQHSGTSTASLCASLRKKLPGMVLLLGLTQQDPDILPRPNGNDGLVTLDYIDTARITIECSFEEYWAGRGKNLRQGLRRQRNRLAREDVSTKLVKITDVSAIEEAVTAYGRLESASWKSGKNTAISIDNDQGQFYCEMLQNFAREGQAVIYQYWYNDLLAVTDLCLQGMGTLIVLKTTYDESIQTTSPANLMRQEAFEGIFDAKVVQRIEFYGRVMDWHTKWSNEIRTIFHVNSYINPAMHTLKSVLARSEQQ
jgi:Acetyltransferase (GNAT) domain